MAARFSYKQKLIEIVKELPEKAFVFEWGPGESTRLISEERPDLFITSVEHKHKWYEKWVQRFISNDNIVIKYCPYYKEYGKSSCYVTFPLFLNQKYDFVFVDGRARCDCLVVASLVLKNNGLVLLHDSDRSNYRKAYEFYGGIEDDPTGDGVCVLSRSKYDIENYLRE